MVRFNRHRLERAVPGRYDEISSLRSCLCENSRPLL